jgi:hypothetical protein
MVADSVVYSNSPMFDLAKRFVLHTSRSIFLTGKAGTGKTTFLKKIKETTSKNTVVVAPTGVAAINAGGTTIHSFFQLPFTPFIPVKKGVYDRKLSDRYSLLQNLRIESEKRNLFRDLELLIIDEVSMVRCDILDSIDVLLRHFRRKENLPFGGVQVLFIGDLFQLPPVVQPQEWFLLSDHYQSPFFFDAHVIREARPLYIELKKIFRQSDEDFIEILNNVRNNEVSEGDLRILNGRYDPEFTPPPGEKYITLTTHNSRADKINSEELGNLVGPIELFESSVEGDFPERAYPTEKILQLKKGAQVMFVKNDVERIRRYYNGKIGTVSNIVDGKIYVEFPGEIGELEVEKDTWRNVRYTLNSVSRSIEEEVIGTFTQYPVRLAWAITIHKSQGLTFEKAIIDAGSAFAPGQVYVALSRCTTLRGMVLKSRIFRQAIKTDDRVIDFADEEMSEARLKPLLKVERQQFLVEGLMKIFDFSIALEELDDLRAFIDSKKNIEKEEGYAMIDQLKNNLYRLQEIADKFSNQLRTLVLQQDFDSARKRVVQAVEYFREVIENEIVTSVNDHYLRTKEKKKTRKYVKLLSELITFFHVNSDLLLKAIPLSEKIGSPESGED